MLQTDSADRLAARRAEFVHRLDAYSEAQRAFQPAPEAWSPAHVAEHVWRAERATQTQLRRALAADPIQDLGTPDVARLEALEEAFAAGGVRANVPPAAAPFISPQGLGWEETRAGWTETEARWTQLDVPPELSGVGLIPHPRIGPIDAELALRFLAAHAQHHLFQLNRIEASEGFPAPDGS